MHRPELPDHAADHPTPTRPGKGPAGGEGKWTTVTSRRARRLEKARPDGTASSAARKAAAARAATWRRTVAAVVEFLGEGE